MRMFSLALSPKWQTRWGYRAIFLVIGPAIAVVHCEWAPYYRWGNVGNADDPQSSTLSKLLPSSLLSLSSQFVAS